MSSSNGRTTQKGETAKKERSKHIEVCVRLRPLSVRSGVSSSSFFHNNNNSPQRSNHATANSSNSNAASANPTPGGRSSSRSSNLATPRKPAIPKFRGSSSQQQQHPSLPNNNNNNTNRYAWDVVTDDTVVQAFDCIPGRTSQYTLDRVYGPTASTAALYQHSVHDLVTAAMEGYHTAVLAYGQTSTGKTHTMTGTVAEPGLIPLAVRECFGWLRRSQSSAEEEEQQSRDYLLRVSYLEVYKEHIKDLLATTVEPIRLFENSKTGLVIRGLKEEVVTSPEQVFSILAAGEARRHVGATHLNQHSSRSHVMLRLWIESKSGGSGRAAVRVSSLSLVDLAGSESVRLTGSTERQSEGHYINKSLMTLGKVVYALSSSDSSQHVPYRDSKLTRLLQPSLSGSAQVVLVCCISPMASHMEESHNTFKFAVRAKKIPQKAVIHEEAEDKTLLQSYRDEIEDLKHQLQEAQEQLHLTKKASSGSGVKNNDVEAVVEEEMQDLIQAIQTMEKLILKTRPTTNAGDDAVSLDDPSVATTATPSDATVSSAPLDASNGTANNNTQNFQSELTRVQNLLGTVLQKRHTSANTMRDLRAQLEEQEVTGTLLSADASFLQKALQEKTALLVGVSKMIDTMEEEKQALEAENRALRRELALLRRAEP